MVSTLLNMVALPLKRRDKLNKVGRVLLNHVAAAAEQGGGGE
jgi:hypothetical protein